MHKLHRYLVITLSVLSAILILQNMQTVNVNVLFWQLTMPRALLIALILVIGVVIGLLQKNGRRPEAK